MAQFSTGCLVCGAPLAYASPAVAVACVYCGNESFAEAACANGHYVCDHCHSMSALDLIEQYCCHADGTDPLLMADVLMRNPAIKMHGPEHHFLVPAVIITAYFNSQGLRDEKVAGLSLAKKRSADVKGGFCGFHGTCGAAMGAGIACSIITGATPLSGDEWRLSNLMTATCLMAIANAGGPRCCKRDVYLAILNALDVLNDNLSAGLTGHARPVCSHSRLNSECLGRSCSFFAAPVNPAL